MRTTTNGREMLMSIRKSFAAGVLALCVSGTAFAGLIGKTFGIAYHHPDIGTIYPDVSFSSSTFTVGSGVETVGDVEGVTSLLVDLADSGLTVTFETVLSNPTWNSTPFNGIILTSADLLDLTTPIMVDGSLSGFDASRVSIDGNRILLNWSGLSYVNGSMLSLRFGNAPNPVPEPNPLALLGLGFALAIWSRRARG
ncbi:PEP-CTERM sorting domain-containing protein [Thauera sp.]|uniref:PEP-CTERM sorting domain-containing protein n=1 Tax=Thauera sp. TaxID=1905334 RepID=UPI0039E39ADE